VWNHSSSKSRRQKNDDQPYGHIAARIAADIGERGVQKRLLKKKKKKTINEE
jgi:hypothetical protein